MKQKPQTLKGFRDFLPEELRLRKRVIKTLETVFEEFGFEPLETPALESAELLLGKYGEEADKLIYQFEDRGKRQIGLRYDLTIPTARVLAQYQQQLKLPFKRYQIQPVWRAEKPQRGRYREFIQCDVDTFGVSSVLADAEIIALTFEALRRLGLKEFIIKINSRAVLFSLLRELGVKEKPLQFSLLQSLDKLEKVGQTGVTQELLTKRFEREFINKVFKFLSQVRPDDQLEQLFGFLKSFGVAPENYRFSPFLVRGLDYYTGPIFETEVERPKIGSITGGGRYDELIKQLGGPALPATGMTLGLDRLCELIKELELFKFADQETSKVLVTIFNQDLATQSVKLFSWLKQKQIKALLYPDPQGSLAKQLRYADNKRFSFAIILGPEEAESNQLTVRWLKTGEQRRVTQEELIKIIRLTEGNN